jgi:hypothetical protein
MVEQDFSGDYGYDLADEVRSMVPSITDRARRSPVRGMRGTAAVDPGADGDFGYDMAHGS